MKPSLLSVPLVGNMPPPSYQVTIPPGREWVYEIVPWVFVALAVAAGGLWLARRRVLRPATRRTLLWLAAGGLAVGYSSAWLWGHRDAGVVPPDLPASVAVWMHGVWGVSAAVVLLAGWRHVRGGPAGRRPVALVGRALALAVVTLAAGGLVGALGFRLAFVVLLPGYWLAELGGTTEWVALLAFLGGNVVPWWAAWAVVLWSHQGLRADMEPAEPHS